MLHIKQTDLFALWFKRLRNRQAKGLILERLDTVKAGHLGDVKQIDSRLWEMRIHTGKGYRLYYTRRHNTILLLICGEDKDSQRRDISKAKRMLKSLQQEES